QLKNPEGVAAGNERSTDGFEYHTIYHYCPICKSPGLKTIQHIKQCAMKNSISPKVAISLLRSCPKSQKIRMGKNAAKSVGKNSQKSSHKRTKNKVINCELLNNDTKHKQYLIEKKISGIILVDNRYSPDIPQ